MTNPFYDRLKNSEINIDGPFWSAEAKVIKLEGHDDLKDSVAFRSIFVDRQARNRLNLPGTVLAMCFVSKVTVRLNKEDDKPRVEWNNRQKAPEGRLSVKVIRELLGNGTLSLLLLQTRAEDWSLTGDLPRFACLGGEMNLFFSADSDNNKRFLKELYEAVSITQKRLETRSGNVGPARMLSPVAVHASGLTLYGAKNYPWQKTGAEGFSGPFLLARQRPDPIPKDKITRPVFRLAIEIERMTEDEKKNLRAIWSEMKAAFDARKPEDKKTPRTVTLEIVSEIPNSFWELKPDATGIKKDPDFKLEQGEVSVTLSDQPLFDSKRPPNSLARFLAHASIKRDQPTNELKLTINAGKEETSQSKLEYKAEKRPDNWQEKFDLIQVQCAYSPVETPQFLRLAQGLPAPVWERASGFLFSVSRSFAGELNAKQVSQGLKKEFADAGFPLSGNLEVNVVEEDNEWTIVDKAASEKRRLASQEGRINVYRAGQEKPEDAILPKQETVEPPLLWGFMPLADGWAQLPVANLTEQIYFDSGLAHIPDNLTERPAQNDPIPLLQGAVSYGNDRLEVIKDFPDEHAWSLTLTDASAITGNWTLDDKNNLKQVRLEIFNPEVALNGVCWLSTKYPTVNNALPDLDDWVGGLESISLKTVDQIVDIFPPLMTTQFESFNFAVRDSSRSNEPRPLSAEIESLTFSLQVEASQLVKMKAFGVLPEDVLNRQLPLVWRRHPTLPMVQTLPLTQSLTPPSYPSPSRQLIPLSLPESKWEFKRNGGATNWLTSDSEIGPTKEWANLNDLPLISLSLPGLELDPKAEKTGLIVPAKFPPAQYRHDLPYLDEINALAQLPKTPKQGDEVSPLPDDPPPQPPRPLEREDYAEHWRKLSERASLAAADAVSALQQEGNNIFVQSLIEPLLWPVSAELKAASYPGELRLANKDQTAALVLSEEKALLGISGKFVEKEDNPGEIIRVPDGAVAPAKAYTIIAGSLSAYVESTGEYRDQRGLLRSASSFGDDSAWLKTAVRLRKADKDEAFKLVSARKKIKLFITETESWGFWFRDLPIDSQTGDFVREPSTKAEDVNDPEALSKEQNFRSSYEWRLEPNQEAVGEAPEFMPFFGLQLYPLTLKSVSLKEEQMTQVEIIGRLQLPFELEKQKTSGELTELGNAVQLTFTLDLAHGDVNRLTLKTVNLVSEVGDWPLALKKGEAGDAPRLTWGKDDLQLDTTDPFQPKLVIKQPRLNFLLFDEEWSVQFTGKELRFPAPTTAEFNFTDSGAGDEVIPAKLTLKIETAMPKPSYSATLSLKARLRSSFEAEMDFPLVGEGEDSLAPKLVSAALFGGKLKLDFTPDNSQDGPGFLYTDRVLEFKWTKFQKAEGAEKTPELQLLPGVYIIPPSEKPESEAPGFAALTFAPGKKQDKPIPRLKLRTAFVEALFNCDWNIFLQSEVTPETPDPSQVFNSSAGRLIIGYVAQLGSPRKGDFEETLLLNGFLELKNLISWPTAMIRDERRERLVLPSLISSTDKPPLHHLRHTVRVLFNQHRVPVSEVLEVAPPSDKTIFRFQAERAWQFLAVVEHQLIQVFDQEPLRVGVERRWTTSQEVRLLTPKRFSQFLEEIKDNDFLNPINDDDRQTTLLGYYQPTLRGQLVQALNTLSGLPTQVLMVEASATHLVKQGDQPASGSTTPLQFLSIGSQNSVLSTPADYSPSDPRAPEWALWQIPFIGRLQRREDDGLEPDSGARDLQIDPILRLKRGRETGGLPATLLKNLSLSLSLSSWGFDKADEKQSNVPVFVTSFEWIDSRELARPDQTSLIENWFRLNHPVIERAAEGVQSVTATLPNGPARLSRAAALQQAFLSGRTFYPPKKLDDFLPPPVSSQEQIVWREKSLLAHQGVTRFTRQEHRPPYAWAATGLQILESSSVGNGTPLSVAFSPDGKHVAVAGKERFVKVFSATDDEPVRMLPITGEAQKVTFSRTGKLSTGQFLAAAGSDGTAHIWSAKDFTLLFQVSHNAVINDLAFSPDETMLATAGDDRSVRLWELKPGNPSRLLGPDEGEIYKIVFSPDGKFLASVGAHETGRVWNVATGKRQFSLEGHNNQINWVAYGNAGTRMVTASASNSLRVRKASDGDTIARFTHEKNDPLGDAHTALFSPDDKFVVSASGDNTARVWDIDKEKQVGQSLSHSSRVNFAIFLGSGGGLQVLTASNDGTARLWQASTSKELKRFKHDGAVIALALSPDEKSFITACADGMVRLWSVDISDKPIFAKPFGEAGSRRSHQVAATLIPARLETKDFLFSVSSSFVKALDEKQISSELKNIFANKGFPLSGKLQIKVISPKTEWSITDNDLKPPVVFELRLEESQFVARETRINIYSNDDPRPLSFAVSPYTALGFDPALEQDKYIISLVSVELLCLDLGSGALRPVASRLEEETEEESLKEKTAQALDWARETHRRLSPESPVAILRMRAIKRRKEDAPDLGPVLITTFSFAIVPAIQPTRRTTRRAFSLRSPVEELRFREGQFGGFQLPDEIKTFELAPPQVIGLEPIYLDAAEGAMKRPADWPWGVSLLRASLRFTAPADKPVTPQPDDKSIPPSPGVVGRFIRPKSSELQKITLWWQAVQNFVQYRSALGDAPAGGLPPLFRARAIKSFLPRLAQSLLPPRPDSKLQLEEFVGWQPVLPGRMRFLVAGGRPGVMYAMYNHLLRQEISFKDGTNGVSPKVTASGSVPVQHRTPRPVTLPPNVKGSENVALQTWASFFDPSKMLFIDSQPTDESFFAATIDNEGLNKTPNRRLRLTLKPAPVGSIELLNGGITTAWDGKFAFDVKADSDMPASGEKWVLFLILTDLNRTFDYQEPDKPFILDASGIKEFSITDDAEKSRLQEYLKTKKPGETLTLRARVRPTSDTTPNDNFFQEMYFTLRVLDTTTPPLPLRPRFIHFEDPEYNRRLSSQAAHASASITDQTATNERIQRTLTLSTDRREYNSDSRLFLRLDWDLPNPTAKVELTLRRLDGDLNPLDINSEIDESGTPLITTGKILTLALNKLKRKKNNEDVPLRPGDYLELILTVTKEQQSKKATVSLPIVAQPVTPVPEAAYALLRRNKEGAVECVRFAWGAAATRIELINPDDLRTEVVRRRAVFRWTDSDIPEVGDRAEEGTCYALQKITQSGATHFPKKEDFVCRITQKEAK